MKKEFFSVKKIAILGMLLALNVVLAKFSIHTLTVKVGFAFITLVISAMMYGPVEAGIVGALGDVLGYVINPVGAFFPGFTITAFLTGVVYGFFLKKNVTIFKAIGAAGVVQFVIGLICNTYLLTILTGQGFIAMLPGRVLQAVVLFMLQTVIIVLIDKLLMPHLRKFAFSDTYKATAR